MSSRAPWFTVWVKDQMTLWWREGVTTSEMARRLGVTKNQIIRQSRHLDVERRASPILREVGSPPPAAVQRPQAVPRLPPLPSLATIEPPAPPPVRAVEPVPAPPPFWVPAPRPVAPIPAPAPAPAARRKSEPCCWVTVEGSRSQPWLYCEAEALRGKPYCAPHNQKAHVTEKTPAFADAGGD